MCFSIKVMNFKIVILTCVINQTRCYLIYTHFLNILWKNFIKCDPLQKMYVWLKYSTSLWTLRWPLRRWGNMTCFIQLDIMNSCEMTKCGQKLNKKISFTVTVLLCQLFCRDTTCSHSSSDKHTNTLQHGEFTGAFLNISLRKRTTNPSLFVFYSTVQVKDS